MLVGVNVSVGNGVNVASGRTVVAVDVSVAAGRLALGGAGECDPLTPGVGSAGPLASQASETALQARALASKDNNIHK